MRNMTQGQTPTDPAMAPMTPEPVATPLHETMASMETPMPAAPTVPDPVSGTKIYAVLPQFQKTTKRGKVRMQKKEPTILLQYALTTGGLVVLDEPTYTLLTSMGLPKHRVVNAVSDLKKYYGMPITANRQGRVVVSYLITL